MSSENVDNGRTTMTDGQMPAYYKLTYESSAQVS